MAPSEDWTHIHAGGLLAMRNTEQIPNRHVTARPGTLSSWAHRAVTVAAAVLCGCTFVNVGPGAAERQTVRATFRAPAEAVYRAVLQQASEQGWPVLHSDRDAGTARLVMPGRMSSWGDTLGVSIVPSDSATTVTVRATLAQSRRRVEEYLAAVDRRLR